MIRQDEPTNVESIRRRFRDAMAASPAKPVTREWVLGLFERGLRIADELESVIGSLRGKRVLELGTAYAGDLAGLYARGACCVGSDYRDYDYASLKSRLRTRQALDFISFDCMKPWPIADASFDVVFAIDVVEMVPDLNAFFGEITRVLRPGGVALVQTGVGIKLARKDPIYNLPLIALLPNRLRRVVAERIFRRNSGFRLSNHNFNSAYKFRRYVRPLGYDIRPEKFAGSPIMKRVSRWPLARLWQHVVRNFAFDFVLIVPAIQGCGHKQRSRESGIRPDRPLPLADPAGA